MPLFNDKPVTAFWAYLAGGLLLTVLAFWPGLAGPFLFDDFGSLGDLGRYGGVDDWHTFKKGLSMSRMNALPDKEMRLTYAPAEKHNCSIPLHIDSRDFFFATYAADGFQTATLPNSAEFNSFIISEATYSGESNWPSAATLRKSSTRLKFSGEAALISPCISVSTFPGAKHTTLAPFSSPDCSR